jgi:hypothetical protein
LVKQTRSISIVRRVRNAITAQHRNNTVVEGRPALARVCPPFSRPCHGASGPARQGDRVNRNNSRSDAGHRVPGRSHDLDETVPRSDGPKAIFSRPPSNAPANLSVPPIGSHPIWPHPIWRWNGNAAMVEHESAGGLLSGTTPRRSGEKRAPRRSQSFGAPGRGAVGLVGGVPI